jgi:hypothetical protein
MSDFLTDARAAKDARRATVLHSLAGHPAEGEAGTEMEATEPEPATSFDGGARRGQPAPEPGVAEFYGALLQGARGGAGGW